MFPLLNPLTVSTRNAIPTHITSIGYTCFKIYFKLYVNISLQYGWDIVTQRGTGMLGNTLMLEPAASSYRQTLISGTSD